MLTDDLKPCFGTIKHLRMWTPWNVVILSTDPIESQGCALFIGDAEMMSIILEYCYSFDNFAVYRIYTAAFCFICGWRNVINVSALLHLAVNLLNLRGTYDSAAWTGSVQICCQMAFTGEQLVWWICHSFQKQARIFKSEAKLHENLIVTQRRLLLFAARWFIFVMLPIAHNKEKMKSE